MVVDTMVFAYALLGVPKFRDESLEVLTRAREILVPDSFRAEFVNVVWQWVHSKGVSLELGLSVLDDAESFITTVVPAESLWERALTLAVDANHPAYDALFVALAEVNDTEVVTYDLKMRRAFSDRTLAPADFLSRI